MTDLPRELRARMGAEGTMTTIAVERVQRAADGTRKLRLALPAGGVVHAVIIPDSSSDTRGSQPLRGDSRVTLCVSSQVGCALDCRFCATATLGFSRQMTAGEIVDQVWRARALLDAGERVTNVVFMGMGEPLHNYQNVVRALDILLHADGGGLGLRRITVSTAGLVPAIERYAREPRRANLAISLNATTDELRDRIMPINRKWNLARLLAAARAFPLEPTRRLTFEYVLLAGVNDSDGDARRLPRLLHGLRCKVNLIPWNSFPGSSFVRPDGHAVSAFQEALHAAGVAAFVRTPRGDDIDAACGQLAARPA